MPAPERSNRRRRVAGSDRTTGERAPWGTISRERIVDVATEAVRSGGYEELTIRGLAAELGVAPMSLYRHVRDKNDLLDEVVDRLLAATWRPRRRREDWQAWLVDAADRLRKLLVEQPAALHVYLTHPVVSPAAIARMEEMLGVLRSAVGDEQGAKKAYGAIQTYTIGFATLEASRERWSPEGADETALELAAFTTPHQFVDGLRYLLEGVERETTGGRPGP